MGLTFIKTKLLGIELPVDLYHNPILKLTSKLEDAQVPVFYILFAYS